MTIKDSSKPQRTTITARLVNLARTGQLTERDEEVFEYLGEFGVLSLDHVHRLFWSKATQVVTYQRLNKLAQNWLVRTVQPLPGALEHWELQPGPVYDLGPGGQLWFDPKATIMWHEPLTPAEMIPRLLTAELFVRLVEAIRQRGQGSQLAWTGPAMMRVYQEKTQDLLIAPDGLGQINLKQQSTWYTRYFFVHCDGFIPKGSMESGWLELIRGYDRFYKNPWQHHPKLTLVRSFPLVAIVIPSERQLASLATFIQKYRAGAVTYYLATWPELIAGNDLLNQHIWQVILPDNRVIGQTQAERLSLINLSEDEPD